jgi:hypothetical protein
LCYARRSQALDIVDVALPLDGSWTNEYDINNHEGEIDIEFSPIVNTDRPKMYYFMVFDCDVDFSLAFVHPEIRERVPALHVRWEVTQREGIEEAEDDVEYTWSHLSLEDEGEHELHFYL